MKRLLGIGAALLLVAGVANATLYSDAININFALGTTSPTFGPGNGGPLNGYVSGLVASDYYAASHWVNTDTATYFDTEKSVGGISFSGLTFGMETAASWNYYPPVDSVADGNMMVATGPTPPLGTLMNYPNTSIQATQNNLWNEAIMGFSDADAWLDVSPLTVGNAGAFVNGKKYDVAVLWLNGVHSYDNIQWTLLDNGGAHWTQSSSWGTKTSIHGTHNLEVFAIQYLQVQEDNVPEPSTWLLLGGSLLGLCVGGFRRFARK